MTFGDLFVDLDETIELLPAADKLYFLGNLHMPASMCLGFEHACFGGVLHLLMCVMHGSLSHKLLYVKAGFFFVNAKKGA